jgi:hypothetical protein
VTTALVTREATTPAKALATAAEAEATAMLEGLSLLDYDSAPGREDASELLGEIKGQYNALDEAEHEITDPLAAASKAAKKLFKKPKELLEKAEKLVKSGIAAGLRRSEEAAALALAAAHESGDAEAMAAVELDKPSGISVRQLPRVRYTDASLVPREFCEPSHSLVLEALQRGVAVAGAELYFEDSVTKR